jgi:hypothetical protein
MGCHLASINKDHILGSHGDSLEYLAKCEMRKEESNI